MRSANQPDRTPDERKRLVTRLWHSRCFAVVEMARQAHSRRLRPWLGFYGLVVSAVLLFGSRPGGIALSNEPTAPAPEISAPRAEAGGEAGEAAKVFRPTRAEDHGSTLNIQDLGLQDLLNQRAIEVFTTAADVSSEGGARATFGAVEIRNCEIAGLRRDELGARTEVQVEGIRITGGGDAQGEETDVLLEDVYIHDGQAVPIRIQEGKFGTITFRRVRIERMLSAMVQVSLINSGSVRQIRIEDSPGLVVRLMGQPGSVGEVVVEGSPEAKVRDELTPEGRRAAEVADAGKVEGGVEPVKLSAGTEASGEAVASTPASPKPAAPAPKPEPAQPAKAMEMTATAENGEVRITVANVPKDVSHVSFSVFNRFDYRIGAPVVVTEAPWEATIKVGKAGNYTARATVTRSGGDTDRAMEKAVEVR